MGIQINGQTDTVTAIDGSITVGADLTVPGVLTYDDVTSIDSVGVITARSGINVTSGNIGIGENNPQNSLHISGSSPSIRFADTGANASAFSIIEDNDGLLKLRNDAGNSGTGSGIAFEVDAAERLRITSAGLVGIGTDSPDSKLTIGGSGASAQIEIKRTNVNTTGAIGALNWTALDGHSVANIFAQADGDDEGADIVFKTTTAAAENSPYGSGTIERFRIHSDGVIQTFNHAECQAYHDSGISITGGDGSSHYLTFTDFRFNRGGYTINGSNKIVLPKTGAYRILTTIEGMIGSSAYSIRAMRARPRIDGTSINSATGQSQWHSVAAGPSSNTHWTFHDQYYFTASAGGAVDIFFQWYPYASRTETLFPAISLFYIG